MRIHYGGENAAMLGACQKEAEGAGKDDEKGWKLLFVLQKMKSKLIQEAQIEKELINVINSISSSVLPGNEMVSNSKLPSIT